LIYSAEYFNAGLGWCRWCPGDVLVLSQLEAFARIFVTFREENVRPPTDLCVFVLIYRQLVWDSMINEVTAATNPER
jgi:hypothetical protein